MTAKAYKSPLGWFFTAEEEARYRKAIEGAVEFFRTYGRGRQPEDTDRVVRDHSPYDYCRYYDKPVGSLSVIEETQPDAERIEGDWMTLEDLAEELGRSIDSVSKLIRKEGLTPRSVKVGKRPKSVYRLSEVREALTNRGCKLPQFGDAPLLTEAEYRSGRWMRCFEIAQRLGIGAHDSKLNVMLLYHKVEYKLYAEKKQPYKFYEFETVRNLPYIQNLISRLSI